MKTIRMSSIAYILRLKYLFKHVINVSFFPTVFLIYIILISLHSSTLQLIFADANQSIFFVAFVNFFAI